MTPLKQRILFGVVGWGGGMFLVAMFSTNLTRQPLSALIVLMMCLAAGALWGLGMHYLIRVLIPILARHAGIDEAPLETRARRPSLFQRLTPSLFSGVPVFLAIFYRSDLLWSALCALTGPAFAMLPLSSQPWSLRNSLVRSFAGFVLGTAVAMLVELAISHRKWEVVLSDAWLCATFSALWTFAQAYSIWQFRIFKSQSDQPATF